MGYIKRHSEQRFMHMQASYKAVLLFGARQVGKTTMLRYLHERDTRCRQKAKRSCVTLDNMMALDLAKHDPEAFFRIYKPPVLIREIQYAPELLAYISAICDKSGEKGQFWLTCSQWSPEIDKQVVAAGSALGVMEMSGLSRREAEGEISAKPYSLPKMLMERQEAPLQDIDRIYDFIWRGGMPEVREGAEEDRPAYFASYIDDVIVKDAIYLAGVTDPLRFRRFMTAAAKSIAEKVNYKALAESAGISQPTAKEWLILLEKLGIVYILRPFLHDGCKRLAKTAKLYFRDTGLCAYLAGYPSYAALRGGAGAAQYAENYVVMELVKNYTASTGRADLWYYRNAKAKEIDLLLLEGGLIHPFEIQMLGAPDTKACRKFGVLQKAGVRVGSGGILCANPSLQQVDNMHFLVPCGLL